MNKRLLVIGDLLIDYYHYGTINRISPEAPIPVFDEDEIKRNLGGAGNVAVNIKSLLPDYEVDLLCIRSATVFYENELRGVAKIESGYITKLIEKHRFIDKRNNQQIGLRLDKYYDRYVLDHRAFEQIEKKVYDIIVLSDYDKGSFDNLEFILQILKKAENDKSCTILDSKSKSLNKFSGVEIFKPNNKEFEIYNKDKFPNFKYVIRTESENGMTLYDNLNKEMLHTPSHVKDIVSTVGAGDTALAGLVWGISKGLKIDKSMMCANYLAGRACLHPGTYIVTQDDLESAHGVLKLNY